MTDFIKERYYYCKVIIPNKGYASFEDSVYKVGCTDCLIEYTSESIYLHFDRLAPSMNHAIASIANNVKDAFKKYENFTEFTIEYLKNDKSENCQFNWRVV